MAIMSQETRIDMQYQYWGFPQKGKKKKSVARVLSAQLPRRERDSECSICLES